MSYYTSIVPVEIVEMLYKAGCPNIGRYEDIDGSIEYSEETYASIFDGLIEKGVCVSIHRRYDSRWCAEVEDAVGILFNFAVALSFEDAANQAILSAANKLLKEKKKYEQDKIPTIQ